ncbi:MAG TPA: sugar ABC transporter permease [Solirubrobacterales bacterium]|nr:sugar ABC transporter permease [Solirubrobacterales bacterium]
MEGGVAAQLKVFGREARSGILGRVLRGELGVLQVFIALALIWTIFQLANDRFLTSVNLTNLMLQVTAVGIISIGVVLVLLLGEIDLSVGAVSGLAAGVMAVLTVQHGWSPELAIVAGLLTGTAIGLFNGFMVTFFRIPSFVVTLAGLLAWQGALLQVLGETGTVNLPPSSITDLTSTFYGAGVGWTLAVLVTAGTLGLQLQGRRRRQKAGLETAPLAGIILRTVVIGAAVFIGVAILLSDRGVPLAVIILLALTAAFAFMTDRTRFGRHIYAVGGNAEAARRAGIPITRVRITVFAIASTMAAAGGIMAASRLIAVNQSSGSGDLLLLAIAGPVIAGTSLFGGRGTVWSALLGALVIGSISNGMDLLGLESSVKFMITGGVLLAAVTLDALARRQRSQVQVT